MSLESVIAGLTTACKELTSEVANKMKGIDKKVDEATQAVPIAIRQYSEQVFYIDAVNGNDSNEGSESSPFQTINKVNDVAISGGALRIYLRKSQVHIIENIGVLIQTGSINVDSYGAGEKPKIIQQTKYSAYNDAHYAAGFGVRNGSICFTDIVIDTVFDVNNPEGKGMDARAALIQDFQGSTSVHFYSCHIDLNEMPIMAVFSGHTGRDLFMSNCEVSVSKNETNKAQLVRSRTGGSFGCIKLDVYNTALIGGLKWSDLINYYDDHRNIVTNLALV